MELATGRLTLRPWREDEAERLLDIMSRVEVVRWLDDGPPKLLEGLAEAVEVIRRRAAMVAPICALAIVPRETGVPAGTAMIQPIPHSDGLLQVGWNLHPDSWGKGYASEAAAALIEHTLAAYDVPEVYALMFPDNTASIAIAERLGMTDLGITDDWYDSPSRHFVVRPPLT